LSNLIQFYCSLCLRYSAWIYIRLNKYSSTCLLHIFKLAVSCWLHSHTFPSIYWILGLNKTCLKICTKSQIETKCVVSTYLVNIVTSVLIKNTLRSNNFALANSKSILLSQNHSLDSIAFFFNEDLIITLLVI